MYDVIVVGGGAAGMFAAITAKQTHPDTAVALLEKSAVLLAKVRISGGGRCNVTHACFDPALLIQNYPRGGAELRGAFHRFQPRDTIEWFESKGVELKGEKDGRIFPTTNSSETIIQCLLAEAKTEGVEIFLRQKIESIKKTDEGFVVGGYSCRKLILATGSSKEGHEWAKQLGHTIQDPVPSLFTFNVPNSPLNHLSGIAVERVKIKIKGTALEQTGPVLITHFGFSGPAALKLSAWGARYLHEHNYRVELAIDWLPSFSQFAIYDSLCRLKNEAPHKHLQSENLFQLPKNLWKTLIGEEKRLNDYSLQALHHLAQRLHEDLYLTEGKTTHKEEFVTCGGVTLKEVQFKTMESKLCPGLYFAGEILDIDGITGGFNFQNAWTTGFIAGSSAN